MQLKKITFKNFMSFGNEENQIDFTSFNNEIVLITGNNKDCGLHASNAVGKSAIFELIYFGLFEKTVRGLSKEECVNNSFKKGMKIELYVDNLKILRQRHPTKFQLWKDDDCKFDKPEHEISQSSMALTQDRLEKELGFDAKTFISAFFLGQHNYTSFISSDAQERKTLVENLLRLSDFSDYEKNTKSLLKEIKSELEAQLEKYSSECKNEEENVQKNSQYQQKYSSYEQNLMSEIEALNSSIKEIEGIDIDALTLRNNEYEKVLSELSEIRNIISNLTNSINNEKAKIKETQKETEELNNKISLLKNQVNDSKKFLLILEEWDSYEKVKTELNEVNENINLTSKKMNELKEGMSPAIFKIKQINEEIEKINSLTPGVRCSECLREIDPKEYQKILVEKNEEKQVLVKSTEAPTLSLREVKKKHDEFAKRKEEILKIKPPSMSRNEANDKISKIKTNDALIQEYNDKIQKNSALQQEIEKRISDYEKEVKSKEETKKQLENIKKPPYSSQDLLVFSLKLKELQEKVKEKSGSLKLNPYKEILNDILLQIEECRKKIKSFKDVIKEKEDLIPYYEFWQKGFGEKGIKSYVIEHIIPILNDQVNYWLQFFIDNKIIVNFDKFLEVKIERGDNLGEFLYKQGSGGERRRIDLAIMLAFAYIMRIRANINTNFLFLDEIAESIDIDGIEGIYNAMIELSKDKTIFIITHREDLIAKLRGRKKIVIIKENGVSNVNSINSLVE